MNVYDFYNKLIESGIQLCFGKDKAISGSIYFISPMNKFTYNVFQQNIMQPLESHKFLLHGDQKKIDMFLHEFKKLAKQNFKLFDFYVLKDLTEFADKYPFMMTPAHCNFKLYGSQIIPDFLFQSDLETAINPEFINNMDIKHIINLSGIDIPKALNIKISDEVNSDIRKYFETTNELLFKAEQKKQRCLINCAAGVSRSSSITLAYLIKHKNMDLKTAFITLKTARSIIAPNYGFLKQLHKYEFEIYGSNSASVVDLYLNKI